MLKHTKLKIVRVRRKIRLVDEREEKISFELIIFKFVEGESFLYSFQIN